MTDTPQDKQAMEGLAEWLRREATGLALTGTRFNMQLANELYGWASEVEASRQRPAVQAGSAEPQKLWLWKNFVDGRPEYWAFDNPYPTNLDNGDPQTLGEPCGYAIFKPSRDGSRGRTEESVIAAIKRVWGEDFATPPSERPAVQAGSAWMPIETAPKDGTWIQLYGTHPRGGCTQISARWWGYKSDDGGYWECGDDQYQPYLNPTHWMPLPAAPGATPPSERPAQAASESHSFDCPALESGPCDCDASGEPVRVTAADPQRNEGGK